MPYLYTGSKRRRARASLDAARVSRISASVGFYGDEPATFPFGSDFFVAPVTTEMADAEEYRCRGRLV